MGLLPRKSGGNGVDFSKSQISGFSLYAQKSCHWWSWLLARSHHTGLDCIEPLPWSTASMWYWPLSTLEGMECPRAFLRSARDFENFGEPFQREDVHFNTTWSYIINHWSTIDHTWSYMIIHGLPLVPFPQGLCRSAKLIGRALAFHVFSLANHISPWSNSRAVASTRGPPGRWWGRSAKDAHGSGPEQPLVGETACWITTSIH